MSVSGSSNNHPGALIRAYILKPYKLSVSKASGLLGLSQTYLSGIIVGRGNISLSMCHHLAYRFNENAELWATRQLMYTLAKKGVSYDYKPPFMEPDIDPYSTKPRPHPGQQLKQDVFKAKQVKVKDAAGILGIRPTSLSSIIIGYSDMGIDLCFRLMKEFGEKPEIWAIRQMQHDLDKEEINIKRLNLKPYQPK